MRFTHNEVVLIGKILHVLGGYSVMEADALIDHIKLFFMLVRIGGVQAAAAEFEMDLGEDGLDICGFLRPYSIRDIRRILEEVRTGVWTGNAALQPEDVFYVSCEGIKTDAPDNIVPFPTPKTKISGI